MIKDPEFGKIILLNGASSAGKSTICSALQKELDETFLQFSLDLLMFNSNVLPQRREKEGLFSWPAIRTRLFDGYFNCLSGLAMAGNNLLVDYIIESASQLDRLIDRLGPLDVFLVGVHCPLEELLRREEQRGDRTIGDAEKDFQTVHTFTAYDFGVDSRRQPDLNASAIAAAWKVRIYPSIFDLMSTSH